MSRRRHQTLSEIDGDSYDLLELEPGTWDYKAGLPTRGGSKTEGLRTLGSMGGCWCGLLRGHDWLGKSEGEPHPRSRSWGRVPMQ